jgi:hypothetical protein
MATRSQVLSMFGATPEQIREQELQRQQSFLNSQQSGFGRSGAALGLGLGRLFGGKSEQLTQAEQLQERLKGVDVNSPDALREAAKGIADIAPEQALQIASYARQLERDQMAPTVNLPVQVGTKPKYMLNPLTQQYEQVGEEPIFRDVPFERLPSGLKSLDPRYSLDMVDKETLGQLNMPSEDAAAKVNAEQSMARVLQRDEKGNLVEPTPPAAGAQPTLQMTTEMTGPAISPTPVIQGTSVNLVDRLKTDLADVNRQLSLGRKTLSTEDKKFFIERRKELLQKIAQEEGRSSTSRTRRK